LCCLVSAVALRAFAADFFARGIRLFAEGRRKKVKQPQDDANKDCAAKQQQPQLPRERSKWTVLGFKSKGGFGLVDVCSGIRKDRAAKHTRASMPNETHLNSPRSSRRTTRVRMSRPCWLMARLMRYLRWGLGFKSSDSVQFGLLGAETLASSSFQSTQRNPHES
jgi:hypothetical protein